MSVRNRLSRRLAVLGILVSSVLAASEVRFFTMNTREAFLDAVEKRRLRGTL